MMNAFIAMIGSLRLYIFDSDYLIDFSRMPESIRPRDKKLPRIEGKAILVYDR
jgi:hypothetical protein